MFALLMGLPTISPAEVHRRTRAGELLAVDVNHRSSWISARVPGALHLGPGAFAQADLPADRATPLVFYCSNAFCRKAPMAARRARSLGFRDVRVMPAGISGWIGASLPTESGEPAQP
jgi:rhodanese-related sulfurtransferase